MKKVLLAALFTISISNYLAQLQSGLSTSGPVIAHPAAELQFNADSLSGFDLSGLQQELLAKGVYGKEYVFHIARMK